MAINEKGGHGFKEEWRKVYVSLKGEGQKGIVIL